MKNFKRISTVILAIIMLFGGMPMTGFDTGVVIAANAVETEAEHKTYEDYVYIVESDEERNSLGIAIVYYMGNETDIVIPAEIENIPVTRICGYSFSPIGSYYYYEYQNNNLADIKSVSMPDSIEYINEYAFTNCKSLVNVKLSANLKEIGEGVFFGCVLLENLEFGNKLEGVGKEFIAYTQITDLVFPGGAGVQLEILPYALRYSNVINVTVQSDYIRINNQSFMTGNKRLNEVIFEGEVVFCRTHAFGNKENDINFPEKVIFKNKFVESVYEAIVGYYKRAAYVDNWQNTGWTVFFKNRNDAEWLTEGEYTYFLNNDKAVITDYTNADDETAAKLLIPQTLGGKTVSQIGYAAFKNAKIKEVTIPYCVEYVGSYAFEDCELLEKVDYNNSSCAFGTGAFKNCEKLKNFVFPENTTEIPDYIFYGCSALQSVTANGAVVIGNCAFSGCVTLDHVLFSDKLYAVKDSGFARCSSLESIGVSGEKITQLGSRAFSETDLNTFVFSSALNTVPSGCFSGTSISRIIIPEGIEIIESAAFSYCNSLTYIELPDTLTVIESSAFRECDSLTEIKIPSSVTEIGSGAFCDCTALSGALYLDKNIRYVGRDAFSYTNFTSLYYNMVDCEIRDSLSEDYGILVFDGVTFENIIIGNDVNIIPFRMFANQTKITNIEIPDSVITIDKSAFMNCTALKSVSLSDSVTEILNQAFYGCTSLTELTVPKGVKRLSKTAIPANITTVYFNAENCEFTNLTANTKKEILSPFANSNVTTVVIGKTVKRIPDYFFSYYEFVYNLILPESVTEIGKNAFKNSAITTITFPSKLISIESEAFCSTAVQITRNTFPNSLRMIGEKAFADCDAFTEIYIPDSVVYVDESVFMNCDALTKVKMSVNVKYLMAYAFYGCKALSDFEWDADVKLIGEETFAYCEVLSDFNFLGVEKLYPNSFNYSGVKVVLLGENKNEQATDLVSVEKQSFKSCSDLETLSVGGNVATIKSEAFADCSNLETAVISNSVINIANDAFDGCDSLTIYCMEDSYAHQYAVQNEIPVSTFVIAPIPNQTYTGKKIEPDVDVSVSNKYLAEKTDFTVKYTDNINVGTAKVTVSGMGVYKVLSSVANFTIITRNIAPVNIVTVADQNYTGNAVTPSLTVTDGGKILKEGTDYTVSYKDNVNVGTATATIKGIGNYSGSTSVNFKILEQNLFQRIKSAFISFFSIIKAWFKALIS